MPTITDSGITLKIDKDLPPKMSGMSSPWYLQSSGSHRSSERLISPPTALILSPPLSRTLYGTDKWAQGR